jgi:hypothetical protein
LASVQVATPPPETEVTLGGVELLVSTVSTIRSPAVSGVTDSVVPAPVRTFPTVEIGKVAPLPPPLEATVWPQALYVHEPATAPDVVVSRRVEPSWSCR